MIPDAYPIQIRRFHVFIVGLLDEYCWTHVLTTLTFGTIGDLTWYHSFDFWKVLGWKSLYLHLFPHLHFASPRRIMFHSMYEHLHLHMQDGVARGGACWIVHFLTTLSFWDDDLTFTWCLLSDTSASCYPVIIQRFMTLESVAVFYFVKMLL